jgi:hypothetical protein
VVPASGVVALSLVLVVSTKVLRVGEVAQTPVKVPAASSAAPPTSDVRAKSEPAGKTLSLRLPKLKDIDEAPSEKSSPRIATAGKPEARRAQDVSQPQPEGQYAAKPSSPPPAVPEQHLRQLESESPSKVTLPKGAAVAKRAKKDEKLVAEFSREAKEQPAEAANDSASPAEVQRTFAQRPPSRAEHGEEGGAAGGVAGGVVGSVAQNHSGKAADLGSRGRGGGLAAAPSVQAEEARKRGDSEQEVTLLRSALKTATGEERARILRRLCEALDALKRPAEADAACDELVRDYPGSQEANAVMQRQKLRAAERARQ